MIRNLQNFPPKYSQSKKYLNKLTENNFNNRIIYILIKYGDYINFILICS